MARSAGPPSVNPAMLGMAAWRSNLIVNDKGHPRNIIFNADVAFSQDPLFLDALAYNEFRAETTLLRAMPWDPNLTQPRPWEDKDDYEALLFLQEHHIYLGLGQVRDTINGVATRNSFHPVKQYFDTLKWDGQSRLGDANRVSWLTYYCGVDDSPFVRAIGTRWMVSAIARIYEPGCQADSVLVLEGKTGIGKSSVFRTLGGPWYSGDIKALGTADAQEQIQGVWIEELDELDAVQRQSDWQAVISFISRTIDHFRLKYGRRSAYFPRQCVFGGTTEKDAWQREFVGYRRWWPVLCHAIDLEALKADRDQLWAEALARYQNKERWWLHEQDLIRDATIEQEARVESDPWEERIIEYCRTRKRVRVSEVLQEIGVPLERAGKADQIRVSSILRRHGWQRERKRLLNTNGVWELSTYYVAP